MKLVEIFHGWGIYENTPEEVTKYGFRYTLLTKKHTQQEGYWAHAFTPEDSYGKHQTRQEAIEIINFLRERGLA